ncbi:hypothetical protein D8S78_03180 [Natrialba swarupiae]|nr:hypothetical protein [Natrialba swarupiae]
MNERLVGKPPTVEFARDLVVREATVLVQSIDDVSEPNTVVTGETERIGLRPPPVVSSTPITRVTLTSSP